MRGGWKHLCNRFTPALVLTALSGCGARSGLDVEQECAEKPLECVLGFEECDKDTSNGCETWVDGDDTNCGACGSACPAGTFCAQGSCEDPDTIVDVAAAFQATCARRAGGEVLCWGSNERGQLGDLAALSSHMPRAVPGLSDATSIRGSSSTFCATRRSGTPVCWGNDQPLHEIPPIEDLAVLAPNGHSTCALLTTGAVLCWGANDGGQLGDGTFEDSVDPVAVLDLVDAVQLERTCVLRRDGTVWCWGYDNAPEQPEFIPGYENTGRPEPLPVEPRSDASGCSGVGFRRITHGDAVGGAIDALGRAYLWGSISDPVIAKGIESAVDLGAAQGVELCFLHESAQLTCWSGYEQSHKVGSAHPPVFELDAIRRFSAGWAHACAVSFAGGVSCWGNNDDGALGWSGGSQSDSPVSVDFDN
jgi:hypothetical protein